MTFIANKRKAAWQVLPNDFSPMGTSGNRVPPVYELLPLVPHPKHKVIERESEIDQLKLILAKKRMNSALSALSKNDVVFIDEFHTALHLGAVIENKEGTLDNYLKPLLTDGLVVWGATTTEEFFKAFAHDHAFIRRFTSVFVSDLYVKDTASDVQSFVGKFKLPDEIMLLSIAYAAASIPLAHLPEAVIELIDRAITSIKISVPFDLNEHCHSLAQLYHGLETYSR